MITAAQIKKFSVNRLRNKDTIREIFETEDEFEKIELKFAALARAKELKILTEFKERWRAFERELKELEEAVAREKAANEPHETYCHNGVEYNCGTWNVRDDEGIYRFNDKNANIYACNHPMLLVQRLKNVETQKEKVVLEYLKDGQWRKITVDREVIAKASRITELSGYGIDATSTHANNLVNFFSEFESKNQVELRRSTSKFGWQNDFKEFVPFDGNTQFDVPQEFGALYQSMMEPRGEYDDWKDEMRKIRQNSALHCEPQLCVSAALSSILVKPLGLLPYILNIWGHSGKGKTLCIMIAASVWADPGENRFMMDATATRTAFEARLGALNNLPLLIDDLTKARDNKMVDFMDLIYVICSGNGKSRSNVRATLEAQASWSNATVTNMEDPLTDESMKGGALNRVIDFAMDSGNIFEDGNRIAGFFKEHYGHAGRDFIKIVREQVRFERIKEIRRDFELQIRAEEKKQGSVKEDKQRISLSVLLTADKLATDYIFQDGIYLDLGKCVSHLKGIVETSEGRKAYENIMAFVTRKRYFFYRPYEANGEPRNEYYGFIQSKHVYINPGVFRQLAEETGFIPKTFFMWAKQEGILKANSGRNDYKARDPYGEIRRYICVKIAEEKESEEDEEYGFMDVSEEEQLGLPFD